MNSLVVDSIIYRLSIQEALCCIETRFKKISEPSYKQRKAKVPSDESTNIWLNYFTRIGFVKHHKEQIEHIEKLQNDSMRQFFVKSIRQNRNNKILKLKQDIRDIG